MSIGESVSRISEFNSEKVIRANLYNDKGIHICKSMAAYKLYGKIKNSTTTPDNANEYIEKLNRHNIAYKALGEEF